MAKVLNNTDQLTFILTSYGLNRVSAALSDPSIDLNITKIKVGNGDNYEYYEPSENQEELKGPISDGEFYIVEKELLEDNLTVCLHAIIPENFQNAEIREVGVYETTETGDKLFAISTQQPLLKPYISLNYLISVDYYAFLKSQNLSELYDRITLSQEGQVVTEEDFEKLMSTILFTESNLMEQINGNTRAIGLGRVDQLQAKVSKDQTNFGYVASYNNYTNLLTLTESSKIVSYWLFNYPRRTSPNASITDIGLNGTNLYSNLSVNNYNRVYKGSMPMLSFSSPNYFYLTNPTNMNFVEDGTDVSFTMAFAIDPIGSSTRTLLARSNYAANSSIFEVNELMGINSLEGGTLQIKLFTDENNYITFTSAVGAVPNTAHSVVFSYNASTQNITAYIKGRKTDLNKEITGTYTHMNVDNNVPLTSYITTSNGAEQYIDSDIGIITVIKDLFNDSKLSSISLNLEATMGNNPCIKSY